MHNSGYSTMCGHATIAIGRWAVESGAVCTPVFKLQCPCGVIDVTGLKRMGWSVLCRSEASQLSCLPETIGLEMDSIGCVVVDIAYGGAYYAIVRAAALGLDLFQTPLSRLVSTASSITEHLRARWR